MGGQAFANWEPPVKVLRMPPDVYRSLADDLKSKLETLFERVTIPREAPGKLDHGDIDFLVEGIRSSNGGDIWTTIKYMISAELHLPRGDSHSFGIRHPNIPAAYIQVDVEICPGNGTPDAAELFEWTKFMKGDSDLLQIVGVVHRPLGITCNDRGLHIRVEEIEPYNKKKALLFMTRDPNRAMEFYGLDVEKYMAGFESEADLFKWVSNGRFFSWKVFDSRTEKSNDRSRQNKRAMFRSFVEEYMPAHSEAGQPSGSKLWSRREVLDEALDTFDKHGQYDAMLEEHNSKEAEEALWKQIRELLPVEGSALGVTLKGLKRWVDFNDGQPFIADEPLEQMPIWTANLPLTSMRDALQFVADNWPKIKDLEQKRARDAKEVAMNGNNV